MSLDTAGGDGERTRQGRDDLPNLAEIFRQYAPFAWRTLRRLGVPESDVEDVCQEVFVVVHRKLDDCAQMVESELGQATVADLLNVPQRRKPLCRFPTALE